MTTTLRPTGPERRGPGGERARDYLVCVNSRPVGSLALGTDRRFGPRTGRIYDLRIDKAERRRGRGAVAALAAEEVLRGWGCRRLDIAIPADAAAALRLAGSLGYVERGRVLAEALPGAAPPLPEGTTDRPMTEPEYRIWEARAREKYARTWIDRGVPEDEAEAAARSDHARALPEGLRTPGAVLRVLLDRDVPVGTLWLSLGDDLPSGPGGYVYSVEVAGEHRGRGHGRSLMLVAEREGLAAGARRLGLYVFADNEPALGLYRSLGYAPLRHHLVKALL